jgi:hypothetical protein
MAPLFCTFFFFIFTLNCMGLIPAFATATSNLGVTSALALVAVFVFAAKFVINAGMLNVDLLENGYLASAKVTKKIELSGGENRVYRLYYEYAVNGKVYKSWADGSSTSRLEDEALEPLLYPPAKPSRAMLLDSLPAQITVDRQGLWVHRFAFMGYVYLAIPILVMGVAAYLAWMKPLD